MHAENAQMIADFMHFLNKEYNENPPAYKTGGFLL